jgi:hypothetical protein
MGEGGVHFPNKNDFCPNSFRLPACGKTYPVILLKNIAEKQAGFRETIF